MGVVDDDVVPNVLAEDDCAEFEVNGKEGLLRSFNVAINCTLVDVSDNVLGGLEDDDIGEVVAGLCVELSNLSVVEIGWGSSNVYVKFVSVESVVYVAFVIAIYPPGDVNDIIDDLEELAVGEAVDLPNPSVVETERGSYEDGNVFVSGVTGVIVESSSVLNSAVIDSNWCCLDSVESLVVK